MGVHWMGVHWMGVHWMGVHRMIVHWPWSLDWVGGPLNGTGSIGWGSSVGVQLDWVCNKFPNMYP